MIHRPGWWTAAADRWQRATVAFTAAQPRAVKPDNVQALQGGREKGGWGTVNRVLARVTPAQRLS